VLLPRDHEVLLTPAEVAALFRVDPKTVTRWAKAGKLTAIRTLGGHRRYRQSEVQALLKTIPGATPSNNLPRPQNPTIGATGNPTNFSQVKEN
jgi:excisionase family DNA binding protein